MDLKNSMLLANMISQKQQIMYATIKGSLTENDGVFSGFSTSNYLLCQTPFDYTKNIIFNINFKTSNDINTEQVVFWSDKGFGGIIINSIFYLHIRDKNGNDNIVSNFNLSANTEYELKAEKINNNVNWYLGTTNNLIQQTSSLNRDFTNINTYQMTFGYGLGSYHPFLGSINLNLTNIKIGNIFYNLQAVIGYTIVGSPTIVDGVVSGFVDRVDYLDIPRLTVEQIGTNSEFICKFNSQNAFFPLFSMGTNQGLWIYLRSDHKIRVKIGDATQHDFVVSNDIDLTQDHICKVIFKNYSCSVYLDGNLIETFLFETPTNTTYSGEFRIGGEAWVQSSGYAFTGCTIDLNYTQVKENNKLYFNGQPSA